MTAPLFGRAPVLAADPDPEATDAPDVLPGPPGVSALAGVIAGLLEAALVGDVQPHELARGLILTAGRVGDAPPYLALGRDGGEPDLEEARTVAREAGWAHFGTTWRKGAGGRRWLIVARSGPPPKGEQEKDLELPPGEREHLIEVLANSNSLFSEGLRDHARDLLRAKTNRELVARVEALPPWARRDVS